MSLRAIIFDRDNTLMRFVPESIAQLESRIHMAAPSLPPSAAIQHWESWPGPWPRNAQEEPHFWSAFWASFAARYHLDEHSITSLQSIGGFYHTCFAAYPDSLEALRQTRALGLRLAVLTNFELPSVGQTLHYAGIDPTLFDVLVSSASIGFYKPHPQAYLAVAAALDLPPDACLFIDDLQENVEGARAVGMRSVRIDRTGASDTSEAIPDLRHLTRLIAASVPND
jgi:HAD superfamily hydrolase (TIGR01509 family)